MSPSIDLNGDPEAVIPAFLALPQLRVLLRIEEARMRIERLQHAVDRAVDEAIRGHFFDVLPIDGREGGGEHAVLLLHLVLGREGRAAEQSTGNRRDEDGENCHGHEAGRTHMIES